MDDRKRFFLHRLMMFGSVLLFAVVFFLIALRGRDNLDAEFHYHKLDDGTISVEGYSGGAPKKLTVPDTIDGYPVSQINASAFAEVSTLKSVTLPATVRRIGEDAFYNCDHLEKVILNGPLEEIGRSAFEGCSYLRKIDLPEGLTRIEKDAFAGCTRLPSLKIPASCTAMGDEIFRGCEMLTLDCSLNPAAEQYATQYGIPVGFERSESQFYLKLALSVLIPLLILVAALILWKRFRKSKKG